MKQIIGTLFLVTLLSLTIFAFNKTEASSGHTSQAPVSTKLAE